MCLIVLDLVTVGQAEYPHTDKNDADLVAQLSYLVDDLINVTAAMAHGEIGRAHV